MAAKKSKNLEKNLDIVSSRIEKEDDGTVYVVVDLVDSSGQNINLKLNKGDALMLKGTAQNSINLINAVRTLNTYQLDEK